MIRIGSIMAAATALLAVGALAHQPQPEQSDSGDERPPPGPGCVRIAGQDVCGRTEAEVAALLFKEGPQVRASSARYFSVQGFVGEGWPVAVEFLPQPNSRTELVVGMYEPRAIYVPRTVRVTMDPYGTGGRQAYLGRLALPAERVAAPLGSVRIATLEVVSRRLKPNGKVSNKYLPVEVYGIGTGPHGTAVAMAPGGRAVLQRLAFAPPAGGGTLAVTNVVLAGGAAQINLPRSQKVAIDYRYNLRARFELVREELARYKCGFTCPKLVQWRESTQRAAGPGSGRWLLGDQGVYRLAIRAWTHCKKPDYKLCASEAAWATGRGGPVMLVRR